MESDAVWETANYLTAGDPYAIKPAPCRVTEENALHLPRDHSVEDADIAGGEEARDAPTLDAVWVITKLWREVATSHTVESDVLTSCDINTIGTKLLQQSIAY